MYHLIYKYVLIRRNNEEDDETTVIKDHDELVFKAKDDSFAIYKIEFCTIYRDIINQERIEDSFVFNNFVTERMVSYSTRRNTDTTLGDLHLRWYGTTGLASPFGSSYIKLLVLDDNFPSYMTCRTSEEYDEQERSTTTRPLGHLPIWARYSDDRATVIPKKRTMRLANLDINETTEVIDDKEGINDGILNVPWNTQVLTCMCMSLHEYESRKDRRHNGSGNPIFLATM